jgi:hypothetical protein
MNCFSFSSRFRLSASVCLYYADRFSVALKGTGVEEETEEEKNDNVLLNRNSPGSTGVVKDTYIGVVVWYTLHCKAPLNTHSNDGKNSFEKTCHPST